MRQEKSSTDIEAARATETPRGQGTDPVWFSTTSSPKFTTLDEDIETGVCIVGAGIAGLSTAYFLAREGKAVVVLDKNSLGRGETLNTSAHLSNAIDAGYRDIERYHGEQGAKLAAQSHTKAITTIESIAEREGIDCDFQRVNGYFFLGANDSPDILEEERLAAHRAGVAVRREDVLPFPVAKGPFLTFPDQAEFHPGKYIAGLANAVKSAGGQIYTGVEVAEITGGGEATIRTKLGRIIVADAAVVATNTPFNDRVAMHTKQAAYRTYIIGVEVPAGRFPNALWWDTEDPFHYVRLLKEHKAGRARDILIIGGEDHKTGQPGATEVRFARLLSWGRSHFGELREPEFHWSGQIMESDDGLAFIGRNPGNERNVFIATGDSGVGLTHGTIAGSLISDLIMGRENPWETLYDPSRKMIRAGLEYARENANTVAQYGSWISPGDVKSVDEIEPGMGAIVRDGAAKHAVYRDASGGTHRYSAICPHLGCVVAWNKTEKSWDCPCHGSRFDPFGEVLNGPAVSPLSRVQPAKSK
jgi:glycine/D-amino acid oxidase-like deaminating enzyme